jgi:hypothetical protein
MTQKTLKVTKFSGFFHGLLWVPIRFSLCSLCSQRVPNSTSLYSHMFCPKSSPSHLYRWAKGTTLFLSIESSILGSFRSFNFFFAMGQSNWLIAEKKKLDFQGTPNQLILKRISSPSFY